MKPQVTAILGLMALAGCSADQRGLAFLKPEGFEAANPVVTQGTALAKVELVKLLTGENPKTVDVDGYRNELEAAFRSFNKTFENPKSAAFKTARNQIQDRLIAASEESCSAYLSHVYRVQTETNFLLGGAALATAAAGTITTQVNVARALAGITGIFTGVRAEFNQDYFANLTAAAIAKAIEGERKSMYDRLVAERDKDDKTYTVEAAVKDALVYHAICSLNGGLKTINDAVTLKEGAGLAAVEKYMKDRGLQSIDLTIKAEQKKTPEK